MEESVADGMGGGGGGEVVEDSRGRGGVGGKETGRSRVSSPQSVSVAGLHHWFSDVTCIAMVVVS